MIKGNGGSDKEIRSCMIRQLRAFLDAVSSTGADAETLTDLTSAIACWSERLAPPYPEEEASFTIVEGEPSRGRAMCPPFEVESLSSNSLNGTVWFGRHFLGRNGAAHGGAVATLFDEVLGGFVNRAGGARARTAYVRVDYLRVTPIERQLQVDASVVEVAGRKRLLRGTLSDDGVACAKAEALFLTLRPGQP